MYYGGKGIKQDYFKSVELWKKVCNNGDARGCFGVGAMYNRGLGVRQDFKKALKLYGQACDMQFELGCKSYAILKKQLEQ